MVKTFYLLMDYMPLYGDKTHQSMSESIKILLKIIVLTILHLFVKNKENHFDT